MRQTIFAILLLTFSGCATPQLNFERPVTRASKSVDAELKFVSVRAEKAENADATFVQGLAANWRSTLERGLQEGRYFRDDAKTKCDLRVEVVTLKYSPFHFDLDVSARYDLVDRATEKVIYSVLLENKAKDSTFVGAQRTYILSNKVIAENIETFFSKLAASEIKIP